MLGGLAWAETFHVSKSLDTRDGVCDTDCSLREAIIAANQNSGADTIVIPAGTYLLQQAGRGEDQALAGDLDILDDLTVMGAGAESTRIDAHGIDRVFEIHGGAVVRLSGVTAQNGASDDSGGGIYNDGTLTLEDCTLSDNSAGNGGGMHNSATATLMNSMLSHNSATAISASGGGIANGDATTPTATLTLQGCTLTGNSAHSGGGLDNYGTATLMNSMLSDNFATRRPSSSGGGIANADAATLTLESVTLSGNSARRGGGVDTRGTATLTDSMLTNNAAVGGLGGGIANSGTATLINSMLTDNSAAGGGGGGIANSGAGTLTATLTLDGCKLTGNSAKSGGALYSDGNATVAQCTLSNNSATGDHASGGGIYNGGTLMLEGCTLSDNSAIGTGVSSGGGIANTDMATLTVEAVTLNGNSASYRGGGILNDGTASLTNCTLSGNSVINSFDGGGGISNGGGATLTLEGATLSGNSANNGGGIANAGAVMLTNTIIANTIRGGNCATVMQSNGHNLDDDGGCGFFNSGDLSIVTAHLAPLADYGGPTHTHALCTGPGLPHPGCGGASPAIDAGDNAHCAATDQRGAPRPHGSACDMGGFESGAQPPATPTSIVSATPTITATIASTYTVTVTVTGTVTATEIPTTPLTPTAIPSASATGASSPTPIVTQSPSPTASPLIACIGDCNGDRTVTVNELVLGIGIALRGEGATRCTALDSNTDGAVTIDELIRAVGALLAGC